MTDLERFLMEKGDVRVDPSHLKVLGKKAAARYLADGTDLSESVSGLSKEASLNDEQVRRVIEHANTATFLGLFKSGYESNVEFPVADYEKVAAQGHPEEVTQTEIPHVKATTYVPGQEYVSVEEVFGVSEPVEKVASESWTSQDTKNYFDAYYKTKQASADIANLSNSFELQFDNLKSVMRQLSADGAAGYDIACTIKEAGIVPGLANMLVAQTGIEIAAPASVPNRVINKEHGLYKEASALADQLEKILTAKKELSEFVESADVKRREDLSKLI